VSGGVLVVDDDPFVRKLVATTLEDVVELDLHQAGDGLEALNVAHRESPALVLLDIDMPRMGGIEACRRLRQDPVTSSATIVMLTGAESRQVADRAASAGADLFLTKPFSPLELLRLVEGLEAAT
jgi:CheY-like chemotaxis protein